MWFVLKRTGAPKPRNPALIVAISTSIPQYRPLYSQGRELARYLMKKLEFREVASFYSSAFPPEVIVREDGTCTLPSSALYLSRGRRDILLFCGDSSPSDDQYEFSRLLLQEARKAGAREMYSVGARWTETPTPAESNPKVTGFATDVAGVKKLRKAGVQVVSEEPAPFFSSIVVGLAGMYGMRGYKISVDHGELEPHPKSVAALVRALDELIGLDVSVEEPKEPATMAGKQDDSTARSIYQ